MTEVKIAHPSVEERKARGARARKQTKPSGHSGWTPASDRPDPVALLEAQNVTRDQDLVPVRHGRMMVSPFTFYRGAAKIMADDLADYTDGRPDRAAVRGRPPLQLRTVRVARASAALRSQRLRRNAPRPVRVRRQADGGELHDRGAQQRVHRGRGARGDARLRRGLPRIDGRVRGDGDDGTLVRPPVRGRSPGRDPRRPRGEQEVQEVGQVREGGEVGQVGEGKGAVGEAGAGGRPQGAHPRQPPGAVEAR